MDKQIIPILVTVVLFVVWQLLEAVAINNFSTNNSSFYIIKICSDAVLSLVLFYLIINDYRRYNFHLNVNTTFIRTSFLILSLLLISIISKSFNAASIFLTLMAATSEELVFRGLIFPSSFKLFKDSKLVKSAIFSSLLFGAIHLLHLLKYPEHYIGIILQSFAAFSLGILLCYILIKTSNIIVVSLLHFSVNLFLKNPERANDPLNYVDLNGVTYDLTGLAVTVSVIIFIGLFSIFKIRKINPVIHLNPT